jgi:hypothetical protein
MNIYYNEEFMSKFRRWIPIFLLIGVLMGCASESSAVKPSGKLGIRPLERNRTYIEEFEINGLIVQSCQYEEDAKIMWGTVYHFFAYQNDTLVRRIELEWDDCFNSNRYYFLGESSIKGGFHVTYEQFDSRPSYEETKAMVIQLLTLEPDVEEE